MMELAELIAREAIRDMIAQVSQAGDTLDFDNYVMHYTPDGVLAFGDIVSETREEIRAQMERNGKARLERGATIVRHGAISTVIRLVSEDRAEVRSYFQVYGVDGPDHFGSYDDVFERHGERWLIARRNVSVDWVSPLSRHSRQG
jgi:ketosteroid isomerase-like protein